MTAGDGPGDRRVPGLLAATWVVAATDLRRRVRNRSALITAFVGPVVFAVVFSVLVGGASGATSTIGVVALDGAEPATALATTLQEGAAQAAAAEGGPGGPGDGADGDGGDDADQVRFVARTDVDEARRQVDEGDLDAAIVVPSGAGPAAGPAGGDGMAGGAAVQVLRSPDRLVAGQVAESVATGLASQQAQGAAVAALAARAGLTVDPLAAVSARTSGVVALVDVAPGGTDLSPAAYFGVAMSMVFLFFTCGFAARSLLAERRDGTLARLLSGPTAPGVVVAGKVVSVALLGFAGFLTVWFVTTVAFGARWGPPAAVVVVAAATVVAIGGIATLVASFARTPQQAEAYTSAVAFALALVGGNFLGPGQLPEALTRLSLLTPNGWALRAFTDLATGSSGLVDVLPAVAVLLGFAVVFGALGVRRVHRLVSP